MRAIQITVDEQLLAALDKDDEVRREGRSAVFRRAVSAYLKTRRRAGIAEAYKKGYAGKGAPELEGWAGESTWPSY